MRSELSVADELVAVHAGHVEIRDDTADRRAPAHDISLPCRPRNNSAAPVRRAASLRAALGLPVLHHEARRPSVIQLPRGAKLTLVSRAPQNSFCRHRQPATVWRVTPSVKLHCPRVVARGIRGNHCYRIVPPWVEPTFVRGSSSGAGSRQARRRSLQPRNGHVGGGTKATHWPPVDVEIDVVAENDRRSATFTTWRGSCPGRRQLRAGKSHSYLRSRWPRGVPPEKTSAPSPDQRPRHEPVGAPTSTVLPMRTAQGSTPATRRLSSWVEAGEGRRCYGAAALGGRCRRVGVAI